MSPSGNVPESVVPPIPILLYTAKSALWTSKLRGISRRVHRTRSKCSTIQHRRPPCIHNILHRRGRGPIGSHSKPKRVQGQSTHTTPLGFIAINSTRALHLPVSCDLALVLLAWNNELNAPLTPLKAYRPQAPDSSIRLIHRRMLCACHRRTRPRCVDTLAMTMMIPASQPKQETATTMYRTI